MKNNVMVIIRFISIYVFHGWDIVCDYAAKESQVIYFHSFVHRVMLYCFLENMGKYCKQYITFGNVLLGLEISPYELCGFKLKAK